MEAGESGYDQATEDELLAGIDWERDGYRLFEVSTLAASSARGWFGPMGESSALVPAERSSGTSSAGSTSASTCPGGGLVNHDLYRRACELADTELVVLLGEGTFHQFHGGAATSRQLDLGRDARRVRAAARRVRTVPPARLALYSGRVRPEILGHLRESVRLAEERAARTRSAPPRPRRADESSAHALEVAAGVEAERVALPGQVRHEVVVQVDDLLSRLARSRARSSATPGGRRRSCPRRSRRSPRGRTAE